MKWVWQLESWPDFVFDSQLFTESEKEFYRNSGKIIGSVNHLDESGTEQIRIEILSQEAISTSGIEGEIINRDSVQSSIRRHLGLKTDGRKVPPNTSGVAEMQVNLYKNFSQPLSHQMIFDWHSMLMNGRRDIEFIGAYRLHSEPMQIISGKYNNPKLFYEAPPSTQMASEMDNYVTWFNETGQNNQIPTIVFAGIAHIYFEMIHPFEDGNGRIGRALAEKAMSMRLNSPTLNSLSKVIEMDKKPYYQSIQDCNLKLELNNYLKYFTDLLLKSQEFSYKTIQFIISKAKFFQKYGSLINQRQEKVCLRMFDEGIEGFKGGLSANNYITITETSNATATRDLQNLVEIGAFYKTGELKGTRYFLRL